MKNFSRFLRTNFEILKCVVIGFTIILGGCSNSSYSADEIEYFTNVKPKTGKPLIIAFGDSLTNGFTLEKKKG